MIPARFDVVVRHGPCEDDLIQIRNRISAALTPRRGRRNKPTAFKCTFCAEKRQSPECLATHFTVGKRARAGRPANSSAGLWGAPANAAQEGPQPVVDAVARDFSRARSSSTRQTRAQNLAAEPESSRRQLPEERIALLQFRFGSAGTLRRKSRDRGR